MFEFLILQNFSKRVFVKFLQVFGLFVCLFVCLLEVRGSDIPPGCAVWSVHSQEFQFSWTSHYSTSSEFCAYLSLGSKSRSGNLREGIFLSYVHLINFCFVQKFEEFTRTPVWWVIQAGSSKVFPTLCSKHWAFPNQMPRSFVLFPAESTGRGDSWLLGRFMKSY